MKKIEVFLKLVENFSLFIINYWFLYKKFKIIQMYLHKIFALIAQSANFWYNFKHTSTLLLTTFWGNTVFFKAIFITLFLSIGQFALANPTNLPDETHIFNALKTHYAQNTNDSSLKDLFDLKELNHSWQLFAISDKKFQTIEQFPPNKPPQSF